MHEHDNSQIVDQPPPIPNDGVAVWDLVIADMAERDQTGRARYGTPLQVDNGRDHLVDAYQEILDLAVYLRAEIERQHRLAPSIRIMGGMTKSDDPGMSWVRMSTEDETRLREWVNGR